MWTIPSHQYLADAPLFAGALHGVARAKSAVVVFPASLENGAEESGFSHVARDLAGEEVELPRFRPPREVELEAFPSSAQYRALEDVVDTALADGPSIHSAVPLTIRWYRAPRSDLGRTQHGARSALASLRAQVRGSLRAR